MNDEKIQVTANVGDERRSDGFVLIKKFNQVQKSQAALKKLGLFWGIAILCILIPVFHFVLVPLFFFLGFFFARRAYKSGGLVLGGSTHCPHCHSEVIAKKAELNWPISEICQGCARVLKMEKVENQIP